MDFVLLAVAAAWVSPLALLGVVIWRAARRPISECDRRLSLVDEELRAAGAQERAARAALRGERRVVCELQPVRETRRE